MTISTRIIIILFYLWCSTVIMAGRIIYPAAGNIFSEEGTVEAWVKLDFDPYAIPANKMYYNYPGWFDLEFGKEKNDYLMAY